MGSPAPTPLDQIRRRTPHEPPRKKLVISNPLLALTFVIVIVSGIPVWLVGVGGVVAQIHHTTAVAFLPLVLVHHFLDRRRVAAGRLAKPSPGEPAGHPRTALATRRAGQAGTYRPMTCSSLGTGRVRTSKPPPVRAVVTPASARAEAACVGVS